MQDIATKNEMEIIFPPVELCSDNGVMIAWAGVEILKSGRGLVLHSKTEIEQGIQI